MKKFLIKHVGNMGDHLFFVSPVVKTLKDLYPDSFITLVTAWGYKDKGSNWGKRNQDGFCIALMQFNPYVDEIIHWHDKSLSLKKEICEENGIRYTTWNQEYYNKMKKNYDQVFEIDFGIGHTENPLKKIYQYMQIESDCTNYEVFTTQKEKKIGKEIAERFSRPRVLLIEGISSESMRGWNPEKVKELEKRLQKELNITPIWFGAKFAPEYFGRRLTLLENIEFARNCDLGIGVMGGALHFVAGVGTQTITLYGGQPLHRAAPAFFLNKYIKDPQKQHLTIEGPTCDKPCFLKRPIPCKLLTPQEVRRQNFKNWQHPGRQDTKSCLSRITAEGVFKKIKETLLARKLIP